MWEELARKATAHLEIAGRRWKPAARWWGNGLDGKKMEIDAVAESLDGKCLLLSEAKWGDKTNVQSVINKLEEKAVNFPKRAGKKIIPAVWCKHQPAATNKHSVLTPVDVLSVLR